MVAADPASVAEALLRARRLQQPVDASACSMALHGPDDAYCVQALVARSLALPEPAMYWKSGGASRRAILTHAALPPDRVWRSPADARGRHFNLRLIEAEVALRLGRAVDPELAAALTHEEAPALVDAMTVSIEIVDSRWALGVQAPALLKLADLQSHGALVLGAWRPFAPRDWARQKCSVRIGDADAVERIGTHALNDPGWLLPIWLRHATRHGASVPAGAVVTTGTWCGMLQASEGDLVRVVFDGIGEASVQL